MDPPRRATDAPGGTRPLALLVVRHGVLPIGGDEVVAECGGAHVLLAGSGTEAAAAELTGLVDDVDVWEAGPFQPCRWAAMLAPLLTPLLAGGRPVLLPDGPDGRVLAPLLAHRLGVPYLAGCRAVQVGTVERVALVDVTASDVTGGDVTSDDTDDGDLSDGGAGGSSACIESLAVDGPFVATMTPGVRGVPRPREGADRPRLRPIDPAPGADVIDAQVVAELPADVATIGLDEAERIIGAGAGLGSADRLGLLASVGARLGAAVGATRVLTDWGWLPHSRQIGTTGVAVDPRLYLAFGISGAVQHTAGLGHPDHVVAVNTDASCPMMAMADLAVVADAPAVLDALARRLGLAPS